jgi:type VI secretion system secreted protein Hcp
VAIIDTFLKVQDVTGESVDLEHKGEIDVVGWSWGLESASNAVTGQASGRAVVSELHVLKRVDLSTPTLMAYLRNNKPVPTAVLTVRKAGDTPFTFFKIELSNVRVTLVKTESKDDTLVEHLRLGFSKVKVTYTPQGKSGGKGGGDVMFETDAHAGA